MFLAFLLAAVQTLPVVALPARTWPGSLSHPDLSCRVRDSKGKLVRSQSRKRLFLSDLGLKATPEGYRVDHIVPLACGGCDVPSNLSLLSVEEWSTKTKYERSLCAQQSVPE